MITLYEFGSSRSVRCRWLLDELALPFESVVVNLREAEHRGEAFRKINPYGRVPALVDGDLVLFESVAICIYLADRYGHGSLIPAPGSPQRGLHDQWLLFAGVELDQVLWRVHCHERIYPPEKRIPEAAALARAQFPGVAEVLTDAIAGKKYLMGDDFTVADIVLGHTLRWATWYGLLEGFEGLQSYLAELQKRPACPEGLR